MNFEAFGVFVDAGGEGFDLGYACGELVSRKWVSSWSLGKKWHAPQLRMLPGRRFGGQPADVRGIN